MFLYLVQHAEAKREEEDPQRGLTDKGFQDIKKVATYVEKLNIVAEAIFHSGKTRALQTAEVLAQYVRTENGILKADGLAPMDDPQIWVERISKMKKNIIIVGHLPHLAKLSSLLLCGDKEMNIIDFKMAGIVCLKRFDEDRWLVEWMLIPEVVG